MISILLETSTDARLAKAAEDGNERYLCQVDKVRFPLLSQVDECSYCTFGTGDMLQLIEELRQVLSRSPDHIRELIMLAERCREETGSTLTFTPFQ